MPSGGGAAVSSSAAGGGAAAAAEAAPAEEEKEEAKEEESDEDVSNPIADILTYRWDLGCSIRAFGIYVIVGSCGRSFVNLLDMPKAIF